MNAGNCFDFPVVLKEKDILELRLVLRGDESDGFFITYAFKYQHGKWERVAHDPFLCSYDQEQEGCINDPFEISRKPG